MQPFMRRLRNSLAVCGGMLFVGGAGMRTHTELMMRQTESRLEAARPVAVQQMIPSTILPPFLGTPTKIRIPGRELWNELEPITFEDVQSQGLIGDPNPTWDTGDAGWHISSGQNAGDRNVVIAGHSPASDAVVWSHSIFRAAPNLTLGERLELYAGQMRYVYEVVQVFSIPATEAETPEAAAWIAPTGDERLTLVTCWPLYTAGYRVIVVARPVQQIPDRVTEE